MNELGVICVDNALHLYDDQKERQSVYAFTTSSSPDVRDIVFSAAFDDTVRFWVNGVSVFDLNDGHSAHPGAARFKTHLKTGDNVIVLRLGNQGEEWQFCVGMQEGGDGVTVKAGAVAPPTNVAAAQ